MVMKGMKQQKEGMKMMDVFLPMIAVLYISISLFPVVVNRVDANYVRIPRAFFMVALLLF